MERMVLKLGAHELDIYRRELITGRPEFILRCTDACTITEDIDGRWVEEYESGCFFLNEESVDKIIEKLIEVKSLLKQKT